LCVQSSTVGHDEHLKAEQYVLTKY